MPEAPLRAAVIGAGFAGRQHVEALRRLPGVEVAAIAASTDGRARGAAEELGIARWTADWTTLATDPAIDVVHVCVPNDLHLAVAAAALRAGRHVVAEKPLALDLAQGVQLAGLARDAAGRSVLCHNYRFFPMVVELGARIRAGDLGPIHAVRGAYLQDWLLLASDSNWRVDPARGGESRVVADIGTHWVDLAETVTERRLASVLAELSTVHASRPAPAGETSRRDRRTDEVWRAVGTEDQAALLLRFEGGLSGSVFLSQVAAGHKNDLELSVDGAIASARWRQERPDELWVGHRDTANETLVRGAGLSPGAASLSRLPAGHGEGWADGLRNLLGAAYAAFRGGEASPVPLPTFADGVRHLAFVAAALESARRGGWVAVDEVLAAVERPAREVSA